MARLRKIKDRYYAYFYDPTRKPKEKSYPLRVSLKSAAEKMRKRLEEEYAAGDFDPWNPAAGQENLTMHEATQAFLRSRSHLRPKTLEAYGTAMKGLLRHTPPNLPLHHLALQHVRPYIEDQGVSNSTRRHRYRHVRVFINWAIDSDHLTSNPLKGIKLPKQDERLPEFLTPEQLERVLAAVDWDFEEKRRRGFAREGEIQWLKDLVLLAVGTGLRLGELASLRWSHIDFTSGFLFVRNEGDFRTKSGKERAVPLVGDALAVLQRRHSERADELDGPVLTYGDGRAIVPGYASKRFKKYVRLAKLPENIRFHSLRHTCASWLVQRGVSLPIVQEVLGHHSVQVTQRYAHLAPDVMKSAMEQAFGQ